MVGNPWSPGFFFFQWSNASRCQTILEICKEMEQRSPWVPAELAPFFSQHHKWSWSRPEQSTVRLPLCADSIRNNCILASLHSSPLHHRGLTLYCIFCAVGYSKDPEWGEGHCSIVFCFFFSTATCLWIARGVALKLHWCEEKKKSNSAAPGFGATTTTVVFICRE